MVITPVIPPETPHVISPPVITPPVITPKETSVKVILKNKIEWIFF